MGYGRPRDLLSLILTQPFVRIDACTDPIYIIKSHLVAMSLQRARELRRVLRFASGQELIMFGGIERAPLRKLLLPKLKSNKWPVSSGHLLEWLEV